MLLPLGSPLPDDAVSAVRGESGMLGGLSVPLKWGVAVRLRSLGTSEGLRCAGYPGRMVIY